MDGQLKRMLVVAPDDPQHRRQLFPFEIIGVFDPDSPPPHSGPDGFRQNGTFLHFLNWVISLEVPHLPDAQAEAKALGSGLLQVIDGRADLAGEEPPKPEDLIGAFSVENGLIVPGTYRPYFSHCPLTEAGLFKLDPLLCQKILDRIAAQVGHELGKAGHLNH